MPSGEREGRKHAVLWREIERIGVRGRGLSAVWAEGFNHRVRYSWR